MVSTRSWACRAESPRRFSMCYSSATSPTGVPNRHKARSVVIAMHHQDRHGDLLQVFGEVRLGEGDDAVIMRLGASPIIPWRHQFQITP